MDPQILHPLTYFGALLQFTAAALALRSIVLLLAMALDWLIGEPAIVWRHLPHPVVLFGRLISSLDRRWNRRHDLSGGGRYRRGLLLALVLLVIGATTGLLLTLGGPVVVLLVLAVLLAARSLDDHIRAVAVALEDGIDPARTAVGMIVGRDTSGLDENDIARAAIETGAENLSDGVIAPALWFLVAGLPGLIAYKMVNTADSMIGYRNARYRAFGAGAARLDDLMNYVPARLTALLICAAMLARGRFGVAWDTMRRDGRHHASPNAGWPEAAMAGALGVWLAGPRHYGNRIRQARRFHAEGGVADRVAILRSLRILIGAQIIFAGGVLLLAILPMATPI